MEPETVARLHVPEQQGEAVEQRSKAFEYTEL